MNATEARRRRRWWPRSVRARAGLAAAVTAAVVLVGIGWWVQREVHYRSTQIAEDQAKAQLWALCAQLEQGVIPDPISSVPYEVVATGRPTAVAYGGGMDDFAPSTHHVMPAPPKDVEFERITTVRLPANPSYEPSDKFSVAGGTNQVVTADITADRLSHGKAAALGIAADANLRVYVVVLPHTAEEITGIINRLLLWAGLGSLVLIAAAVYFTVRIALRPVEAIRVLTASVTANDPRERVTVPAAGHEIAALATTINTTLQRLDDAAAQQRRFVADAAHELRSPLTTLLASLEVALAYPERTDWPAAATTAARQTRRLQALAEDLLLLARMDTRTAGGGEAVDLAEVASRLVEQYPLGGRELALRFDGAETAYVLGDADGYERLVRNLVDNAVRHAAHRIQVTVREEDGWVVLAVHDDGPGVPGADAERIFERFVRLDDARSRDHGGTGLGLAIARDLAQRHGGTLTLAPRTLGACFLLRLPSAEASPTDRIVGSNGR
ncbi:sensor histidine kinase [Streptomyces acidiscabies]|uniref:histidine kinase n=1 Tax=Streptomyces acidiscabies TaxID=42234 RepID=A0A0L0K9C0_9ACTN|nr:HAMP domain-containing sensor histidine kinase [Streptomyces acidiscabies]KND34692.1 histidine kinase [Streptomyces acidiscabies]